MITCDLVILFFETSWHELCVRVGSFNKKNKGAFKEPFIPPIKMLCAVAAVYLTDQLGRDTAKDCFEAYFNALMLKTMPSSLV